MTEFLRTDVPNEMGRAIGVAVGVAIETGGAAARLRRAAILGLVELLLRERRHQEAEPLQLLGIEDPGEERVVVVDRHQLALRHVAEIGPGRQINRRRKLRQQVIRQVEIEVEAGEVASLLLLQLVNLEMRKHHAAFGMVGVRQWQKAARKEIPVADLIRAQRRQRVPACTCRQLSADSGLHGLAARHRDPLCRMVGEIVALAKEIGMLLLDLRLGCDHARHDRRERLGNVDRQVARLAARLRLLLRVGIAGNGGGRGNREDGPCCSARRSEQDRPPAECFRRRGPGTHRWRGGNERQAECLIDLTQLFFHHSRRSGRPFPVFPMEPVQPRRGAPATTPRCRAPPCG